MSNTAIWIAALIASAVAVGGFRILGRRRMFRGRSSVSMSRIHAPVSHQVSLDALNDVLHALGQAYAVDPGLIRPDDALKAFMDTDSWILGEGTKKLSAWLAANGLGPERIRAETVSELALVVEERRVRQ